MQSQFSKPASPRRVVVTGMGAVSPLGVGVEVAWQRLLRGHSGLRPLAAEIREGVGVQVAGTVPTKDQDPQSGWDPAVTGSQKEFKRSDRFILLALDATAQAMQQAGDWRPASEEQAGRAATVIASGIGGFGSIADAVRTTDARGPGRLSPFTVPSFLVNLAAGHVSIRYGLKGPIGAPATACAASLQAIGEGFALIRSGLADVAVCGGSEAVVNRVTLGAFHAAKALSAQHSDRAALASRPFDQARDGFVLSEGAATLVLEDAEHALARGALPLAEVVGYGTTADAHHITSGPEDGDGAYRSMRAALRSAGLEPCAVDYVSAHATSTPVGDRAELAALARLFGGCGNVAISATKGATGHLLGAAGGLASIFAVQTLRHAIAPATLNLLDPDPLARGLDLITGAARPLQARHALVNAFGFGGVNASLVLRRID